MMTTAMVCDFDYSIAFDWQGWHTTETHQFLRTSLQFIAFPIFII